jgi:hypothetical protein
MTYDSTTEAIIEPTVAEAGNADAPSAAQPQPQALGGRSVLVCDQDSVVAVMHCLDAETITDEGFQQSYPPEAGALAGLDGPHMSVPRGYVVDAGGWIVASIRGHVEGVSLSEALLGRQRGLDVQAAATVAKDLLTALTGLHRSGIAHRRVSAEQVIIRTEGTCVLIGAGLAPREGSAGRDGDLAADLVSVAELFAICLEGRRAAQPGSAAQRGRSAPRQAGDMAEYLYTLLASPTLTHVPFGERAAGVLTVLDSVMAEHFGVGWEEYGREELAARVDAVRRAHFRTTAAEGVEANTRPGGGLRRGRHTTRGARHTQKQQKPPSPQHRAVRYGGPLFAFTVAFTLVLVVASHATTTSGNLQAGAGAGPGPAAIRSDTTAMPVRASHAPVAPAVDIAQSSTGSHSHFTTASATRTLRRDDTEKSRRASGSCVRSR